MLVSSHCSIGSIPSVMRGRGSNPQPGNLGVVLGLEMQKVDSSVKSDFFYRKKEEKGGFFILYGSACSTLFW